MSISDDRLSLSATAAIEDADVILISPVSFFEIGQKVRLGKWPEMSLHIDKLISLIDRQGGQMAELSDIICLKAGRLPWFHRDPFDRMLAATALHLDISIVSADRIFDGLVHRIW